MKNHNVVRAPDVEETKCGERLPPHHITRGWLRTTHDDGETCFSLSRSNWRLLLTPANVQICLLSLTSYLAPF